MTDFVEFPKIARYSREVIVTEKIDGSNAQVAIFSREDVEGKVTGWTMADALVTVGDLVIFAGSRNRWLTLAQDNFNFAHWVLANQHELVKLGPGRHYGEWWGSGIQRGYGLQKGEKRFSLFNVSRWADDAARPACCHVVPVMGRYSGLESLDAHAVMRTLQEHGSLAVPGFMKPEGIVIFHAQGNVAFKKTFDKDDAGKGHGA